MVYNVIGYIPYRAIHDPYIRYWHATIAHYCY